MEENRSEALQRAGEVGIKRLKTGTMNWKVIEDDLRRVCLPLCSTAPLHASRCLSNNTIVRKSLLRDWRQLELGD